MGTNIELQILQIYTGFEDKIFYKGTVGNQKKNFLKKLRKFIEARKNVFLRQSIYKPENSFGFRIYFVYTSFFKLLHVVNIMK